MTEEAERPPGAVIETCATDEHRIGLKPVLRRVQAPRGERPVARGHHRFEWLYVTAFVSPATGESHWYLATGVDRQLFEETLALFAREAGAGRDRIIVLDGAGLHTLPLAVPESVRLVYLPAYTPELQPAETLSGPYRRADRQPALQDHCRSRRHHRRQVRLPCQRPRSRPRPS
ncbi:MAG TPA: transposase [Geminicoccaceae bacterium]|nr:transposase [Geminicoccaceae bacterium]